MADLIDIPADPIAAPPGPPKKKILTINPSYDTGVCAKAAAMFNLGWMLASVRRRDQARRRRAARIPRPQNSWTPGLGDTVW